MPKILHTMLAGPLVALAIAVSAAPAAAQDCCQLSGACDDKLTTEECVGGGGQITWGACQADSGLCDGTTVCCNTSCDDPTPSCKNTTALDCADTPMGKPVQSAVCDSSGSCQGACPAAPSCPAGTEFCGSSGCVNLNSDANNCGVCGGVCPALNICVNGGCTVVTCQAPGVNIAVPPPTAPGGLSGCACSIFTFFCVERYLCEFSGGTCGSDCLPGF